MDGSNGLTQTGVGRGGVADGGGFSMACVGPQRATTLERDGAAF